MANYKPDGERVLKTLRYLMYRGEEGVTWFELGQEFGWHHGQASGVLSSLHREKRISRLKEKRGRSSVYVDNMYVNGRETAEYGVARKSDARAWNDAVNRSLYAAETVRRGVRQTRPLIHNKQCWRDHPDCAIKVVMTQIANLRTGENNDLS